MQPARKTIFYLIVILILFTASFLVIAPINQQNIVQSRIEKLQSLPYLAWVPAENNIKKIGVTKYNSNLAFKGINIYNTENSAIAYLIDMSGKILHTWTAKKNYWQHVEMCDNGDLLAICWNHWITKVDWNSNLKWIIKMHVHHDLAIAQNKDIYTIVKKKEIVFEHGLPVPIYNDYIVIISADGKIKKSISLYKILKEKIPPDKFVQAYRWSQQEMIKFNSPLPMHYNILYINTLEIIKQDIKGLCKQGDLLICARNLNLIGIVDIKNERLLWSWGQEDLDYPHYPTLIENNNILIFDNGYQRGYSRIVELNPLTKNIVWEYRTNPPSRFFSKNRGSNQKLPNGNILITESDNGRAFEITQDGEIVWEFYSPQIRIATKERQALYRVMRITNPENYSFLKGLK